MIENRTITVLLVEDNPGDARLVKEALAEGRSSVAFNLVQTGMLSKALKVLEENKVDVILLDLTLPDSSGPATFKNMHAMVEWVPIILLSGLNDEDLADQLVQQGAQDYLIKGQTNGELLVRSIRYAIERTSAEKALKDNEDRYRKLYESAPVGYQSLDFDGHFITVNQTWLDILGYSREEVIGKWFGDFLVPGMQDLFRQRFPRFKAAGEVHNEFKMVCKDGNIIDVAFDGKIGYDTHGDFLQTHCVLNDITQKKRSEKALLEAAVQWKSTFDAVPDGICLLDKDQRIQRANQAMANMFLMDTQEMIGKKCWEVVHLSCEAVSTCPFQCMKDTLIHQGMEFNRGNQWFEVTLDPIVDGEHKLSGLVHIMREITERKISEIARKESEERYRDLFENSPISLWEEDFSAVKSRLDVIRQEGVQDLRSYLNNHPKVVQECIRMVRLLDVNNATLKMFGAKRKEDLLSNLELVFGPESADQFKNELVRIWDGTTEFSWEGINRTLAGEKINVSLGWSVTPGNEQTLTKVIVSLIDITESKRSREKIQRQIERLTALNEIDRMITSMVDLRTSLASLLNHVVVQLDVDAALVMLVDANAHMLEYAVGRGFCGNISRTKMRIGEGIAGRAALERHQISILDLDQPGVLQPKQEIVRGEDFKSIIAVPLIAKGQVKGVLEILNRSILNPDAEWLDYLDTFAGQTALAISEAELINDLQRSNSELAMAYDATIEGWSHALDLRDKETEGHSQRVADMTVELARIFGMRQEELVHVRRGALLHDIGKMGVPDNVLLKSDPLTSEEWVLMMKHPTLAYQMLSPIKYLLPALDIPYCHHEKLDGSGYPRGLTGEQIPIAARIFAVVDVWDAITSDRPYRKAWSKSKALSYIQSQSGKQFDPNVVAAFEKLIPHGHTEPLQLDSGGDNLPNL